LGTDRHAARRVGSYRLLREIARGGMGAVWEGQHVETGTLRAVKTLWLADDVAPDPDLQARFRREGELQARLEHPHIVRVHQADFEGKTPYLVQDLLPGGTLGSRLKTQGPLASREAGELVAKLAAGLAHAHEQGVLHRDMKPDNVLFDDRGEPCLADFGLAISLHSGSVRLSVTGMAMGTPNFMAPEQAFGDKELDVRTDVYGLGAVLYAALTGKAPYRGNSVLRVMEQVIADPVPDPRAEVPKVSQALAAVCQRAMAKDPPSRYQSALELREALLDAVRPDRARPPPERSSVPLLGIAAAAAIVVLGVTLVVASGSRAGGTLATPSPLPSASDPQPVLATSPAGEEGPWRFDPGVDYYYVLQKRTWIQEGEERVPSGNLALWFALRTEDDPAELIQVAFRIDRIALDMKKGFARIAFDSRLPANPNLPQSAEAIRALVGEAFSVSLHPRTGEVEGVKGMAPLLRLIDESVARAPSPLFEPGSENLEQLKARFSPQVIRRDLTLLTWVVPPHGDEHAKRKLHPASFGSPGGVTVRFEFSPSGDPGSYQVTAEPLHGAPYRAEGGAHFLRQYLIGSWLTQRYTGRGEDGQDKEVVSTIAFLAIEPEAWPAVLRLELPQLPELLGTPD